VNSGIAVSDASPLIALNQIERLDLLQAQFDSVVVPSTVAQEVEPSVGILPRWIDRQQIEVAPDFLTHLDPGEREAIALSMRLTANFLVIDDLPGRHAAERLGIRVIGSLGLLVGAKRRGLISGGRAGVTSEIAVFDAGPPMHRVVQMRGESVHIAR
jgi:predicted nucleic acid-binding protein